VQRRELCTVTTVTTLVLSAAAPALAGSPAPEEPKPEAEPQQQVQPQRQTQAAPRLLPRNSPYLIAQIKRHRAETWRWQRLMGKPLTLSSDSFARSRQPQYRRWVLQLWKNRATKERRIAQNPPRRAAWLCIHRHERDPRQGWQTRTGNGYYGGLQMDISFQRTYGGWLLRRKGTAERWTALEQMWVAERAYRSGRGFYPWPNTARFCGLI
jgi:hypothetical protein